MSASRVRIHAASGVGALEQRTVQDQLEASGCKVCDDVSVPTVLCFRGPTAAAAEWLGTLTSCQSTHVIVICLDEAKLGALDQFRGSGGRGSGTNGCIGSHGLQGPRGT